MSNRVPMINLMYSDKYIFAVPVPEWSSQHEIVINKYSSYIKYPSPKGWDWLRLLLDENYVIIGLSTPNGFKSSDGITLNNGNEIIGTVIRSHIITNAKHSNVEYSEKGVYLILEMFLKK